MSQSIETRANASLRYAKNEASYACLDTLGLGTIGFAARKWDNKLKNRVSGT